MDTNNHQKKLFGSSIILGVLAVALAGCNGNSVSDPEAHEFRIIDGVAYPGQGWNMTTRQQISYSSFGSRLLDYQWFIALEVPDSEILFRANEHMETLGFITDRPNAFNPDGLAVGLSRDQKDDKSWVGLTCAACHTGQVNINGQPVRIDGGQSLINFTQFETELLASLKATIAQPEKWQRFIARLKQTQKNIDSVSVKQQIITRIDELEHRFAINATPVPYGHGRLDAFGQIFNAVTVEALHIPENKIIPDAPTSFPVLWDASHLDVVQWNASAPNKEPGPLAQNATTTLAVYGSVEVLGYGQTYPSSILLQNLGNIQKQFYKLTSPRWPESLAGKLDEKLLAQGEKIYQKECLQCHALVDSSDAKRQLTAVLTPVKEVGTDTRVVDNFSRGNVKTGELEGKHFAFWFGKKLGAEASRLDVVMHVTAGTLIRHPWDSLRAIITEYATNKSIELNSSAYYKARPINGIWASAPYLHNGSVPSVYDLLLPAGQRPTKFYVGNRELDKMKVGNQTTEINGSTLFDASLLGNSNVGHEYATNLSEPERMALLEYIKSL